MKNDGGGNLEIISEELYERAILRGNLIFFHPNEAILVINRCKEHNRIILGIDAFKITENTTQPFSEHSVEFSGKSGGNWLESKKFIEERETKGLVFEIVFK